MCVEGWGWCHGSKNTLQESIKASYHWVSGFELRLLDFTTSSLILRDISLGLGMEVCVEASRSTPQGRAGDASSVLCSFFPPLTEENHDDCSFRSHLALSGLGYIQEFMGTELPFHFLSQNKAILVSGSYHLPRQNNLLTSAARGGWQTQHSSRFLCWREISLHEDSLKWTFAMPADAQGNALERTDNEEILSFTQRGYQKLCNWLRAEK